MSYMQEADAWLDKLLAAIPEKERRDAKRAIKAKLLESYRNGERSREKPPAK